MSAPVAIGQIVEQLEAAGAKRLLSRGLGSALEHFADAGVLAAGKVNIIALDAISDRFGARWSLRRESVHSHVDVTLSRQLGTAGYHLRITDTDVLICQPELSRLAGQAACVRYLRDILSHFLGENQLADVGVHEVLSLSAEGVEARRVDVRAAQAAALREGLASSSERLGVPADSGDAGGVSSVDHWTPFVSPGGLRIRVSCALEPLLELRKRTRIGVRFVPRVVLADTSKPLLPQNLANLSRSDILRIDLAMIARGIQLLGSDERAGQETSVTVPVSATSLSYAEGRAQVVTALKAAGSRVKHGVICELSDIEGAPASVILDCVACIRPFALLVIGSSKASPASAVKCLRGASLNGISIESPPQGDDFGFARWAREAVGAARTVSRSVLIYGVSSMRQAAIAEASGASHVSMAPAAR